MRGADDFSPIETVALGRILWHYRKLALAMSALFALAALAYGLVSPSPYTATAQILVDPRDRQVVTNDINPSAISPDGGVALVESQVSVVQSNEVLLRAIRAANLTRDPEFNRKGLTKKILELFGDRFGSLSTSNDDQERTLTELRKQLTVKRTEKAFVIDVTVRSQSPEKAANIANAIAEAYLTDQSQTRADSARRASEELTSRLANLRARVQSSEDAVTNYRTEHNLVVTGGRRVTDQQLNELTSQLSLAQSRVSALKAQLDHQERSGGVMEGSSEALQSAVVTRLRERESAAVEYLARLEADLGPRHPTYRSATSELAHLRELIAKELGRLHKAKRTDYERALADERALASKLNELKRETLETDKVDSRLTELQADVEAIRTVYSNFLRRAKETNEQANVNSFNVRIITRALPPQQRSFPSLGLLVLGGALTGLGLGTARGLLREHSAPLIMSANQIAAITEVPVIGTLPKGSGERKASRRDDDIYLSADIPDDSGLDAASNRVIQLLLRNLASGHGRKAQMARCVVLTSTVADEAQRRRVAQMIAAVAARNGECVLLIDADIANGKEGRLRGLQDLLRGDCPIEDILHVVDSRDYALIGKGRRGKSRSGHAERDAAVSLIAKLRREFDLTIVDGGAPMENYMASPFLEEADHVVLIAEIASTYQNDVSSEVASISLLGVSLTGVILVDQSVKA